MAESDLPPISNYPAWLWRIFRKIFVVIVFGVGSAIIGIIVFPILRLFNHNKNSFKRAGHKFISFALDFYIHLMSWCRVASYRIDDLKAMRALRGCVIVANHPSLLDVFYILAFVRDADCIVKAGLKKSVVSVIVKNLYISNNIDFEIMQKECVESLHNGGNLIIFPEGTRTPRHGTNQYKKGAARIALAAGANVQPLHIGGNDKYGLGKGESLLLVNPQERYKYDFKVLPQIEMSKYAGLSETIAAKRLTDDMRAIIESVQ
ncbi:MAG: 1-acyl-sn-glycerol-3-phosphate acyltransferase [Treponema sp.]|nr:1-acyl-sn-glycerol-3-phosphate acyltransferase [Treponema sp.]